MQQYRVNYSLLIGLIVGSFVCSGAVYGIWRFQIERKSGWLISEADKASEAHDYRTATQFYSQYLSIHPNDVDNRFKFANACVDLTESDDASSEDFGNTARILETALRDPDLVDLPQAKDLRRRLIALYAKVGNLESALDHLNLMLEATPKDPELQALRASYLARSGNFDETTKYSYKLIGFDPKTGKFDLKNATAPNDPQVYATLAAIVRSKEGKKELAERIADQMVAANPKLAQAYIQRGQLREAWNNPEGARADAEKAYQLKPDDVGALLFLADVVSRDKDYEKAAEYIKQGKKLHPDDSKLYQAAAALEIKQQMAAPMDKKQPHYDAALAQIEEGRKKVGGGKSIDLLVFKEELQISSQDVKGARETLEELQKIRNLRPEFVEYYEARILLADGKWFQASEAFNKLRSKASDFGRERASEIDYNLGLCYERLGRLDLAKDQFELVLKQDPQNEPAQAGVQRVNGMIGVDSPNKGGGESWQKAWVEELKKPKGSQDWKKLDAMLQEMAKKRQLDDATVKLIQAQMLMAQEDFDGAGKKLAEANELSPKNLQIHQAAVALTRVNPKAGPEQALEKLDAVVGKFGDLPSLRLLRAEILLDLNKNKQDKELLKRDLAKLTTGIDQWTVPQKVELWRGMAGLYLNLGMMDEGRQYLTLAADNLPNELPLRLALFSLALEAGDDAAMQEAQDKILQIVGDKSDSAWLYAEARRKLVLLHRNRVGPEALNEIRALANQALQERPDWYELQALLGEVELLANKPDLALEHYDRAEQLGRPTPAAVAQHIRLLAANGRFAEAGKLLDRIPEPLRQSMLGPLYAEILFRSNQVDAALKQALAATVADPKNAQNQYWYGQLLARSSQASDVTPQKRNEIMANAIKAMQKAAELQPDFPEAWFALINYFAMQKDENQAQKALRDAQLALSGDNLPMFLARSYEVLHRWFDAETMYRELYETTPDDLGRAQQLAAFYLGPLYQRPDRQTKVAPLLNQILKAGADKKLPPNDSNLLWARRMAAKIFSNTNEYPNMVKAEHLLAANSQDGNLLIEDKLAMAEILAPRPEPLSRLKAIGLLEDVSKVQPLGEGPEIALGDLYYAVGGSSNWSKYTAQMDKAIARFPNSYAAREAYVRKLLIHGDQRSLEKAATHITAMRKLAPNNPATFELTVRLAGKLGKQQEVRNDLLSRMPKISDIKDLDQGQAQSFAGFASLLVDLGDLDTAEKIYTELAAKSPPMAFELAKFLGLHRDPDQCFKKLNEIYSKDRVNDVLSVAMTVARDRRDKIGDKYDADVQRWLTAGLRENPDSIPLLVIQADFYDLQKKYDDAVNVYQQLLTRKDLIGLRRAVVLNNLSFLLALSGSTASGGDPLKLVEEAEQIMGPNSDILDTKAVVLISKKQYKEAIDDLTLSVTDNPTASKYYHKAVAHLAAGENHAAVEAWQKAAGMGLSHESLNRMEFAQYDDLKTKIDQLRKKSVTSAEPTRKAG